MNDREPLPFGITLLPGRTRDTTQGLQEARDAERLGFNRVWVSERYDIKEAAVLCGAFAAVTERIGVATGLVVDAVRHPLMAAAFGATMQATFGDRFTLGISRGVASHLRPQGFEFSDLQAFEHYVDTLRGLWAGERVEYRGPDGAVALELADRPDAAAARLVYGSFGNVKGAEIAARSFDGVLLVPFMTAEAVSAAVRRLRTACERCDRDPASLTISGYVVTAPGFDEAEELAVVNARALTYLQMPGLGDQLVAANDWDRGPLDALRANPAFTGARGGLADHAFHRAQLVAIARGLPREWMVEGAALGSAEECCGRLQEYFDAGVDEIVFHGSSPVQNEALLDAWRAAPYSETRRAS